MILPNVWGKGGQLFAFSGMDGETDVLTQLVGSSLEKGRGFLFHLDPPVTVSVTVSGIDDLQTVEDHLVCGDALSSVVEISGSQIEISWAFYDSGTLLVRAAAVEVRERTAVTLRVSCSAAKAEASGEVLSVVTPSWAISGTVSSGTADQPRSELATTLSSTGDSTVFAIGYGSDAEEALKRAEVGAAVDFEAVFKERVALFDALQIPEGSASEQRMYATCDSVDHSRPLAQRARVDMGLRIPRSRDPAFCARMGRKRYQGGPGPPTRRRLHPPHYEGGWR